MDRRIIDIENEFQMAIVLDDQYGADCGPYKLKAFRDGFYAAANRILPDLYEIREQLIAYDNKEPVAWMWFSYGETHVTADAHQKDILESDGVAMHPLFSKEIHNKPSQ